MNTFVAVAALCLVALSQPAASQEGKNYVLLIAGSNTYDNYRHQADVCHAYQTFHRNGIPDEQIVVMMYDDIAHNPSNPFKGNIINKPNGENVYPGVLKDYTGKDVNAQVFLAVLEGDKEKAKSLTGKDDAKVIESTSNDNIFVYYADHGAPGIVGMPTGQPDLKARDLVKTLKKMHQNDKYSKMVFYLEACESGSMFDNLLPKDINIYAVTASSDSESSYAWYFDNKRNALLGDLFSVNWMEDTDKASLKSETFEAQFKTIVAKMNNLSHPQQFGDMKYSEFDLAKFFTGKSAAPQSLRTEGPSTNPAVGAVRSEFVPIYILKHKVNSAPENSLLRRELEAELERMETMHANTYELFWNIAHIVNGGTPRGDDYQKIFTKGHAIDDMDCYYDAVDTLMEACSKVNTNTNSVFMRNFYVLVNLCNHHSQNKVVAAVQAAAFSSPLCH